MNYSRWQLWVDASWADDWEQVLARVNSPWSLELVTLGASSRSHAQPVDGRWAQVRGVDVSGAILLRPDGHVIWRCMSLPLDPEQTLEAVLSALPFGVIRAKEERYA